MKTSRIYFRYFCIIVPQKLDIKMQSHKVALLRVFRNKIMKLKTWNLKKNQVDLLI